MAANAPSITDVRSEDQIRKDIESQYKMQLDAATNPLQNQIDSIGHARDSALSSIGSMFGQIMPYVAGQADKLAADYKSTQDAQQGIYSEANKRLNDFKQSRAQSAQALAQQMGGPVALGEFTAGVDPSAESYANLGAGQQLHTLALGQADVAQARAFAGRVFPLVQTEETAKARTYYENQITDINKQIQQLESAKSSSVNKGVTDALIQERQYALQKAQSGLDKIKADRDWKATLRTLKDQEVRTSLAKKEFGETKRTNTANIKLESKKLSVQEKQFAQNIGLSNSEYLLKKQQLDTNTKIAHQKLAAAKTATAAAYLDAAVNPKPGKTVTYSQAVPVPKEAAIIGKVKDAYTDANSPTGYSRLVTVHQASAPTPITEPNALTDYLIAHGVQKTNAIKMVKARLQLPNWQYGQSAHPKPAKRRGK